jgi:hemolysin activation/secretion protein
MKFPASHLQVPNFFLRLISLSPACLFAVPASAQSVSFPIAGVPDIFDDQRVEMWDCSQPLPTIESNLPTAAPKGLDPVATAQIDLSTKTSLSESLFHPIPTTEVTSASFTSIPEEIRSAVPETLETPTPTPSTHPLSIAQENPTPTIRKIETIGNTVLPPEVIESITKMSLGKPATLQELCKISAQINEAYRSRGYILATALPALDRRTRATVHNGTVIIGILEGYLESMEVVGLQRLKADYVIGRLSLGVTNPFNANAINDRLLLLQNNPKIAKVEFLGLSPGRKIGSSVLQVRVIEANFLNGFVGVDNYVAPIVGTTRISGGINYRNFTNNGDDLSAVYYRSTTGELSGFDFNYQIPLNPMNGQLQFQVSPNRTDLQLPSTLPGQTVTYSATGLLTEINYRQPILQNSRQELALGIGVFGQDGRSSVDQISLSEQNTTIRGIKFFQEYNSLDEEGNWSLRSQLDIGVGLFGATIRDRPNPDGRFMTWQGQIQRVQKLGEDNFLIAQAQVQFSPDRLVSERQFTISGAQSVRGYRQNIRSGDNGVRLSLENRTTITRNSQGQPYLQLAINTDLSQVWNNGGVDLPENFLASVGVGVIWEPIPNLSTRFDYGIPLRSISDRGNSFQDSGFNISVGYAF